MNGPEEKNVYFAYFVWCIITLSHTLGVSSLQTRFGNLILINFIIIELLTGEHKKTRIYVKTKHIYHWKINCDYDTSNQNLTCIKKVRRSNYFFRFHLIQTLKIFYIKVYNFTALKNHCN